MHSHRVLTEDDYRSSDVNALARSFIGKFLCTKIDGHVTTGMIVETEAYRGADDKASHAYNGKRTKRTSVMYESAGTAYIYLCYGLHHMMNVVTGPCGIANAVLIRSLEPISGLEIMAERRNMASDDNRLTKGPGSVGQAMGIHAGMTGISMTIPEPVIWLEDRGVIIPPSEIGQSERIGVSYAAECAHWPWRYFVLKNKYVSAHQRMLK